MRRHIFLDRRTFSRLPILAMIFLCLFGLRLEATDPSTTADDALARHLHTYLQSYLQTSSQTSSPKQSITNGDKSPALRALAEFMTDAKRSQRADEASSLNWREFNIQLQRAKKEATRLGIGTKIVYTETLETTSSPKSIAEYGVAIINIKISCTLGSRIVLSPPSKGAPVYVNVNMTGKVRIVFDKKTKVWRSDYVELGKVSTEWENSLSPMLAPAGTNSSSGN